MRGTTGAEEGAEGSLPDHGILLLLPGALLPGGRVRRGAGAPLAQRAGPQDVGLPAGPGDDRRYLVIGRGKPGVEAARQALEAAQRRWFGESGHRDGFILRGPLLADDGAGWVGSALLVQLGDRAAVEAMLAGAPYVRAGLYGSVEVHDWQFGGRPKAH